VADRAADACAELATAVAAVPPGPPAEVVRAQDQAISGLIGSMEALGTDTLEGEDPAVGWVADWRTLHELREAYAASLDAGGQPVLVVPTNDGVPITDRMADAGVDCPAVAELAAPPAA